MKHCIALLLMTFAMAGLTPAQSVSISIRAATQLTLSPGGGAAALTLPPGPLGPSGSLVATSPGSLPAQMLWMTTADSTEASCYWTHSLPSASAGPHEIVMEWTSTAPVQVNLQLTHVLTSPPGTTVPQILVDYGNDGFFESFIGSNHEETGSLTLGPQPYAVRVQFSGGSYVDSALAVRVLPRNDLQIDRLAVGCSTGHYLVEPVFQDRGVAVLPTLPAPNGFSVLVAGLAPQPVVLPPSFGSACLVLPRQDVLLPFFNTVAIPIAIPAAVRPVDLWLQRVWVGSSQLLPGDAFLVRAF